MYVEFTRATGHSQFPVYAFCYFNLLQKSQSTPTLTLSSPNTVLSRQWFGLRQIILGIFF